MYIARGVVFASLVPTIVVNQDNQVENQSYELETVDENTYYLNVEQGTDIDELVQSLSVEAGSRTSYLTQTVYYNGELVVDNKRYNPYVYDGFTTNTPGVYEITYNLQYKYYGENGQSEMISATPVKLVINVEATPPVTTQNNINYSNIILLVSLLAGSMFIGLLAILGKKKI